MFPGPWLLEPGNSLSPQKRHGPHSGHRGLCGVHREMPNFQPESRVLPIGNQQKDAIEKNGFDPFKDSKHVDSILSIWLLLLGWWLALVCDWVCFSPGEISDELLRSKQKKHIFFFSYFKHVKTFFAFFLKCFLIVFVTVVKPKRLFFHVVNRLRLPHISRHRARYWASVSEALDTEPKSFFCFFFLMFFFFFFFKILKPCFFKDPFFGGIVFFFVHVLSIFLFFDVVTFCVIFFFEIVSLYNLVYKTYFRNHKIFILGDFCFTILVSSYIYIFKITIL